MYVREAHNFSYTTFCIERTTFCSFYSTCDFKWLYSTKMPSRRLYTRPLRKFLVFMKKMTLRWLTLLVCLVLLALRAPLDNTTTTWKHIFGSKTLILYDICYGEWRKFNATCFLFFFFLRWNSLCQRLLILCDCLTIF